MATIESYALAAGAKRYQVRYRTPENRQTKKRGFTTKKAAEAFAAIVEVSKMRGEYIAPSDGRAAIGELAASWLERQTHLKPSSFRPIESALRIHVRPVWAERQLSTIRPTEIQQWVSGMTTAGSGATTVIRAFGVLASILDDAVRDRRLLANPARGVSLPRKGTKEHTYLSHQQVDDLARAAGKYETLILVLAYCGLRWGEATALRVRDFNMLRRRLTVSQNAVTLGSTTHVGTPKSYHRRQVPIPIFVVEQLARACEGKGADDLVFRAPKGGYMQQPNGTRGWFDQAWQAAGVPRLTPHDLRHTAASLAVSAGANVKSVQRMLGHASAAMTLDVYADLFDDDLEAVAMAMDQARTQQVVPKSCPRAPIPASI